MYGAEQMAAQRARRKPPAYAVVIATGINAALPHDDRQAIAVLIIFAAMPLIVQAMGKGTIPPSWTCGWCCWAVTSCCGASSFCPTGGSRRD